MNTSLPFSERLSERLSRYAQDLFFCLHAKSTEEMCDIVYELRHHNMRKGYMFSWNKYSDKEIEKVLIFLEAKACFENILYEDLARMDVNEFEAIRWEYLSALYGFHSKELLEEVRRVCIL